MRRLFIILFGLLTTATMAQQTGVKLIVPSTRLEVGESVQVELVCTNIGSPDLPKVALPEGIDLRISNSIPSKQTSISIINSRRSEQVSYTYAMELTALKPGQFVLGPITVEANNTTYQSQQVIIHVNSQDTRPVPKGNRFVFVELNVEPESLYVTQSATASMVIGIRKVVINNKTYEMNLLRDVINRGSQFSVFTNSKAQSSSIMLTDSNGDRHQYQLYRVTKTIRADEIGDLIIGPIFIKANYPTSLKRGFFGGYEISRARKETARAQAIAVEVKGPPAENRPDDFTGAIGKYFLRVHVKPDVVELGQPVTLSITIKGTPLRGLAGPDLAQHPELSSRFDFVKDELISDTESGANVFRRAIFPRASGSQSIPSISWSYFNPDKEKYVTLTSKAVPLTVNQPSNESMSISLGGDVHSSQNDTLLTVISGGLSPNYIDSKIALAHQTIPMNGFWSIGSFVIPPLFYILISFTAKHRARLKHDVGFARRRRARQQAQTTIDRALSDSTLSNQWHGLAEAITVYLTNRFNLPPGQLTPVDVQKLISHHHYHESLAKQISDFLETCDAVRFAPGAFNSLSPDQAAHNIIQWMAILEKRPT